MRQQIKPSEARPGDIITSVLTTEPTIRTVEARPGSGFVKITFADGGVLNTFDHFPITVIRSEKEDQECLTCDGRGGTLSYDSDGDGAWAMTVTNLDLCPDCLGANKCPGCGAPSPVIDLSTFSCGVCSWAYDEDRFSPSEDDYTEGY